MLPEDLPEALPEVLTEAAIREALRVCYDPGLGINIVDLGRVRGIVLHIDREAPGPLPRSRVIVSLFPREEEPDRILAALIINRLLGIYAVSAAEVTFSSEPWTPDRMTPAARAARSKQQGLIQLGETT